MRRSRGSIVYGPEAVPSPSNFDRERELEQIKARYADYERSGRYDLWTLDNAGFDRLVRDRDRRLMDLIRRSLPAFGGQVVDLGAGSSRLAGVARTVSMPGTWLGIDIDPAAVADARNAYPWAEFVVASADQLPLADGSVDVVVASALFSSLPSPAFDRAVAREIGRVLHSDGWLVWYDLRYDNPRNAGVHGIGRRALSELFPGWASELRSLSLLPPVARRLGPLTPIAYPVLHAIPPLRSHLIGRLRCPS